MGGRIFGDWSEEKRRIFCRGVVSLHKIKGMVRSLRSVICSTGHSTGVRVLELYKSEIHEIYDYSRTLDYTHGIRAARIEYVVPDASKTIDLLQRLQITSVLLPAELAWLKEMYPIHVLERPFPVEEEVRSVEDSSDIFEDVYYGNAGYIARFLPEEETSGLTDGDDTDFLTIVSKTNLETLCVTDNLQIGLLDVCSLSCQTFSQAPGCLTLCQTTCQDTCEYSCESGCQGKCESICMTVDQ